MVRKIKNRKQLRPEHDPNRFRFTTTNELETVAETVGQDRALEAIRFGVRIRHKGYNLYVLGPAGYGKHSTVHQVLQQEAENRQPGWDWCYVHNFKNPQSPMALRLTPGWAVQLKDDMAKLIEELRSTLPGIFDSDEYRQRIQQLDEKIRQEQEEHFSSLEKEAEAEELMILRTPQGWSVAPTRKGEVLSDEAFQKLPKEEREYKEKRIREIRRKLEDLLEQIPRWHRERRDQEKAIQKEFTEAAVKPLIEELKTRYQGIEKVLQYLESVQEDIINNVQMFFQKQKEGEPRNGMVRAQDPLVRYQVNVLVDHSQDKGVPIIYEDNPSYIRLIGRVEYLSQYGALVTNFNLIRPGALHRANGGYLIVDMLRLLTQPLAWDALKRALFAQEINIESIGQALGVINTVSLEPEPIPLDIKVVLIGDRLLYYLAATLDPDFQELFKIAADFEETTPRTQENAEVYARLMATLGKKENLRPIHHTAVARILDESVRLVSDTQKLSTHMRRMNDLICEANYWATQANHEVIQAEDVDRAVDKQIYRLARIRDELYEAVERDVLLIETEGEVAGQINALSVMQIGDLSFGQPTRITATARLGRGEVVDIQREVELGGPSHSKGVLILTGYLKGHYLIDQPLSLSASLVFEQTYGKVDGDSASLAEICALISAISGVPLRQNFAVTGSVNQLGHVQAIGGVNQKIEGFYDVCRDKGLTGDQGVLIPKTNVQHLMLRGDVVEAITQNQFSVYPVATVNEAITLLTGQRAGERGKKCAFPKDSVNGLAEAQLKRFAELALRESKKKQSR